MKIRITKRLRICNFEPRLYSVLCIGIFTFVLGMVHRLTPRGLLEDLDVVAPVVKLLVGYTDINCLR